MTQQPVLRWGAIHIQACLQQKQDPGEAPCKRTLDHMTHLKRERAKNFWNSAGIKNISATEAAWRKWCLCVYPLATHIAVLLIFDPHLGLWGLVPAGSGCRTVLWLQSWRPFRREMFGAAGVGGMSGGEEGVLLLCLQSHMISPLSRSISG